MKKIALLLCTLAAGLVSQAQVTLSGTSYTQNFDGIGAGLPQGWSVYTLANTNTLGNNVSATNFLATAAANTAWNNTTGSFKNVASGNGFTSYAAGTVALQTAATDRALGVRQVGATSGTFPSDTGVAFALQLANTSGFQSFNMTFKLQSLDSTSNRVTTWRVDYGFGASPSTFTAATATGTLTTGGNLFTNNTVTVNFGTALNNQAGPVWIRVVQLLPTTGSGNRTTTAIDDVNLTYSTGGGPVSLRPAIQSLLPANNATNVAVGSNLQITFNKPVTKSLTGGIVIRNQTDGTQLIKPTASADVTVSGAVATIANTGLVAGKTYWVGMDSLAFDSAGYRFVGIYDSTTWKFSTVPLPNFRPTITPVYPTDNASSLPANAAATLRMAFSRRVTKGTTGNIVIKDQTLQTSVTKAVSGADVTLNANGDTAFIANVALVAGSSYHVLVDSNTFDTAGYRVVAITDTTRWNFAVQGPVVTVTGLSEKFDNSCPAGLPAGWLQYSVTGASQFWRCNTAGPNYNLVMNGGGATSSTANEDWLITPKLNLVGRVNTMLTFKTRFRFAGPDMEVKYSTNYTGVGDPSAATWSDIQGIAFSTADSGNWVTKNAVLDPSAPLFVAFKYTSTAATPSNGREWSVDSVYVTGTVGVATVNSKSGIPVSVLGAATNGHVNIGFDLVQDAAMQVGIYDLAGREVYADKIRAAKGINRVLLTPQSLQSGMYIIRISNGSEQGVARTFIQ